MGTTKYTLVPRGPVRGIGDTIITEKTEIELNDFQALKVLLQGHSLLKGDAMDEVVKISDFVEGVDPQVINESVNLVPDVTAGSKSVNTAYSKVFGSPREFVPQSIVAETAVEEEAVVVNETSAPDTPSEDETPEEW